MLFSSSVFLQIFLPTTLIIYFIVDRLSGKQNMTFRNIVLLVSSLIFYAWGEPRYVIVMAASILFNYVMAIVIAGHREEKSGKLLMATNVFINVGVLAFFKFGPTLPVGISFYTFQTMSYVIDVYRGKVKVQKNLIIMATYVTMFPQLIAGPIVRYSDIEKQLIYRESTIDQIASGVRRFIVGFAKKVILANEIGALWAEISTLSSLATCTAWLGGIAFGLQIYFDFSGYSDMAIGLGRMFGFEFLENFEHPYASKSITEFWRRWHISLGSWFREYVYIPLGGNKKGKARQLLNVLIVWGLTGLWHGGRVNYLAWGIYYGIILVIEKAGLLEKLQKAPKFIAHFYSMFLVTLGWSIFAIEDSTAMFKFIGELFGAGGRFFDETTLYLLAGNAIMLAIAAFASVFVPKKDLRENKGMSIVLDICLVVLFVISIGFLVSGDYNPFLYFRF